MRWYAVGQSEKLRQPLAPIRRKGFHIDPSVCAANDSTNGDSDDVDEEMPFEMVTPWVLQVSEMLADGELASGHCSPP
jgi:hypothetical protein